MEKNGGRGIYELLHLTDFVEFSDFLIGPHLESLHLGKIKMRYLLTAYTLRVGCSSKSF